MDAVPALLSIDSALALLTLTALEVVLGIDNVVFIALTGRLPEAQQGRACVVDLVLAMVMRTSWVNSTGRRNTSMMRCCNAETETEKVRSGGSACDAFAWSAAGNGACGAATVLEGDRAGAVE